ncbi:GspE/PulE family protein [Rubrivirga marina]|uniref:GspE/PulE family protein n=1 Tax=Rubrivirga marina TaxID=1196024 RepID=UPI000BA916A9|nr:GspE/PulE family protein [Rubrivirga marina]
MPPLSPPPRPSAVVPGPRPDAARVAGAPPAAGSPHAAVARTVGGPAAPVAQDQAYSHVQDRVVQALLRRGLVTAEQVTAAEAERKQAGGRTPLWRSLTTVKGVDRNHVFEQAAATYAFRLAPVKDREPEAEFAKTVIESFDEGLGDKLIELKAVPYAYAQDQPSGILKLVFITEDPMRPELQKVINSLELERFELCYAPGDVVDRVLVEAFPRKNEYLERLSESDAPDVDFGVSFESGEKGLVDEDALEAEISQSALLNLTEAILVEGVRMGASDIHIWPNAKRQTEVHFRVDGRLAHWHTETRGHPEALLAVFKDASLNVDRFERDMAQDGFIQRKIDGTLIRYRVSILPIANANPEVRAESIVIRILDDRKVITDLGKLGLLEGALEKFNQAIRRPHGMVILTGPTGSGKSTTLVAALSNVVTPEVNVLTVEDPVEYIIPGVRQIKLSHKLSLEQALRAILRHDPDVVMVGEMRDKDTAELAIKLANTGHLTFSTLHTNDAPSAVSRLYKMGLEPFLIAYAINLVVAQRLIRTLCPDCRKPMAERDELMMAELGFTPEEIAEAQIYEANTGSSCSTCKGKGYKGRRACAEALYFSPAIQASIVSAGGEINEEEIRRIGESEGMLTLQASARVLVLRGEVSLEEMMRVTAGEH